MTTSLQIGRLGLDIDMEAPMRWEESGSRVTVSGVISAPATAAEKLWQAEQILNLAGPTRGELAVPVISTAWPERDGWYEVMATEVSPERGFTAGDNRLGWSATMRRIRGGKQPRYELRRLGYPIDNDHSITRSSYAGFLCYPANATAPDFGDDTTWTIGSRSAEGGSVALVTGGGTVLYDTVASLYVPLTDAYIGAPKVEVSVGGSWRTVVGKDIRLTTADLVRINNGLIRASWDTTNHRLQIEAYVSGAWEALEDEFTFTTGGATLTPFGTDPSTITVVRNDASRVTIQLLFPILSGQHRAVMFLSLRRGDRNVLGSIKSSSSRQFGITTSTAAAATTLTSGFHRTADDANGNRYVICSPRTFTGDLTFGTLYLNSGSQSFPFGIGVEAGGTAATGVNTAGSVRSQYYAQPGEQIYVSLP